MKNYRQTYPECCMTCQYVVYSDWRAECYREKITLTGTRTQRDLVDALGLCDEYKKREAEK